MSILHNYIKKIILYTESKYGVQPELPLFWTLASSSCGNTKGLSQASQSRTIAIQIGLHISIWCTWKSWPEL